METFVVRVWTPAEAEEGEDAPALRGVVEHIGSTRASPFRGDEELLAALRAGVHAAPPRAAQLRKEE